MGLFGNLFDLDGDGQATEMEELIALDGLEFLDDESANVDTKDDDDDTLDWL